MHPMWLIGSSNRRFAPGEGDALLPRLARAPLTAVAATIGLAMMSVIAPAAPASAQSGVNYVALGDSYASGVGAGSYCSSSGSCDRSANAYPAPWDNANAPASYTSAACSGATTSTVISSQLLTRRKARSAASCPASSTMCWATSGRTRRTRGW
jgi:hypothetical protein